jgi:hypothetical protein
MAQRWWLVAVAGWVAGLMLALGLMLPLAWRPWLRGLRGRAAAAAAAAPPAAGRARQHRSQAACDAYAHTQPAGGCCGRVLLAAAMVRVQEVCPKSMI